MSTGGSVPGDTASEAAAPCGHTQVSYIALYVTGLIYMVAAKVFYVFYILHTVSLMSGKYKVTVRSKAHHYLKIDVSVTRNLSNLSE